MSFNNLSIKYKLLGTFIGLSLVVLLLTAISASTIKQGQKQFSDYVNIVSVRITKANDILDAGNQRAIAARNLIILSSQPDLDVENSTVTKAQTKLDESFDKLSKLVVDKSKVSDKERSLFNELLEIERQYKVVAANVVKTANDGDKEAASKLVGEQCRPLLIKLTNAAQAYIDYVSKIANKEIDNAEKESSTNLYAMLTVAAVSILLALTISWFIISKVIKSINEAVEFTQTVANGDLRSNIVSMSNDETGLLLQSLSKMNDSLIQIVSTVRDSSENIRIGSSEIAGANNDLSKRTEHQASNLEETAATMEEMNSSVRNNSSSTQNALALAQKASDTAIKGGDAVSNVVNTMQEINDSSRKIAEIISSIDGIAFQTNILALNAAVEAARAGDNGRGFAVVATEVRMLAQRSATAAKEIKQLIEVSVNRVNAGQILVETAKATMLDIVEQVQSVTKTISDIRDASIEQSTGVSQVAQAINKLDEVTQQNAALVEESAATADSLKQQANGLAEAVSIFKL